MSDTAQFELIFYGSPDHFASIVKEMTSIFHRKEGSQLIGYAGSAPSTLDPLEEIWEERGWFTTLEGDPSIANLSVWMKKDEFEHYSVEEVTSTLRVEMPRGEMSRLWESWKLISDHLSQSGAIDPIDDETSSIALTRKLHPEIRERRKQVKKLWLKGMTDANIARRLLVSESTVKRDRGELGLKSRSKSAK